MANNMQHRNESVKASLPRSGHSLSHKFGFTAACGMILPTFWDYASPGDVYKIKTDFDLSRALPLLNPACIDIEVVTDYFFVPMDLMCSAFGEVYSGTNQLFSSAVMASTQPDFNDLPFGRIYSSALEQNRARRGVSMFDCFGRSAFRLFDMLGFNPLWVTPRKTNGTHPSGNSMLSDIRGGYHPAYRQFFLWPFLAYQACYQYFYRDEEHETFDNHTFNVDLAYSLGNTVLQFNQSVDSDADLRAEEFSSLWCVLRYVNRKADYFTDFGRSALLTTQNLSQSVYDFGRQDFGLHGWLSSANRSGDLPVAVDRDGVSSVDNTSTSVGTDVSYTDGDALSYSLNTATLRMLFANEKLLRITQAAKKNYDDQTLAHFGVSVPHDVKHQITHFGHDIMKYQVKEVVSTAQTSEGVLGEQAGRLYGAAAHESMHTFKCPVHGVVMALTFVRPDYSYITPFNRINSYWKVGDFWRPEYDHIGMQPIFRDEIQFNASNPVGGDSVDAHANDVVGWQYRYAELKRRFNKASMAFSGGQYASYLMVTTPVSHIFYNDSNNEVALVDSVIANFDWIQNYVPALFKVSPHDTDMIFGARYCDVWQCGTQSAFPYPQDDAAALSFVGDYAETYGLQDEQDVDGFLTETGLDFDENPYQIYATDPFVLNADIKCTKVSFMSENALPKMDL